jgi:chromosomal replication initiator protein
VPETPAQTVLREVSEKYGLTVRQIQSIVRLKLYVLARQEASYRLNKELGFSLTQIGRMLGKRDHTTVLNAIQMYKRNLAAGIIPWQGGLASDDSKAGL